MKRLLWLSFFALLVPLSGCFSYTTLHTATPVEKGTVEVNLAPGVWGVADAQTGETLTLPISEVAGRLGLAEDLDIGVKLFFLGTALDLNYAIVNESDVAFSVDPYISITRIGGSTAGGTNVDVAYGIGSLNLLLDLKPTDIVTLTLGAKPSWGYFVGNVEGDSNLAQGFGAGGMAGVQLRLNENFAIMPSLDVLVPVMNDTVGVLYTGTVGFQFGL